MRGEGSEDIMPFQSSPNTVYRSLDMGLLGKVAFIILVIVTLYKGNLQEEADQRRLLTTILAAGVTISYISNGEF